MPYNIAFDLSHKPRGKIDENYTELRDYLNENDFVCYNFLETPITEESLKPYDVLVFACPDFSKISAQEIKEITTWVKRDGGGLLLLSHAGGDRGRSSNLGELGEQFGIAFESDQVLDEMNNLGLENLPVITAANFIPPHPVTSGIDELCYRAGCSLMVVGSAISVVSSNETSEPFSCPLLCVSETEKGRACGIGSYEMFRDRTGGGFQNGDHTQLALNIFKWLISDYRAELTQHGKEHIFPSPDIQQESFKMQSKEEFSSPTSTKLSGYSVIPISDIESSIKFSSKEELINLLNKYQTHIKTIENNIQNIIKQINLFGNTIFEHQISESEAIVSELPQTYQYEQQYENYSQSFPPNQNNTMSINDEKTFSALPPKPLDFLKKKEELKTKDQIIGLEPVEFKERDTIERTTNKPLKEITKPITTKKEESKEKPKKPVGEKEELQVELNNLESKLNSVFNLINFIEKKRSAGKLDEKSYKNQMKKLEKDLNNTKSRIEEIKNVLEP